MHSNVVRTVFEQSPGYNLNSAPKAYSALLRLCIASNGTQPMRSSLGNKTKRVAAILFSFNSVCAEARRAWTVCINIPLVS